MAKSVLVGHEAYLLVPGQDPATANETPNCGDVVDVTMHWVGSVYQVELPDGESVKARATMRKLTGYVGGYPIPIFVRS